jgi:uncharacterized SAM-binding protein YcdF (DUF218 family)
MKVAVEELPFASLPKMLSHTPSRTSALKGLFVKKERWGLSLRGRLILIVALVIAGLVFVRALYPFLAVTDRVSTNLLVVEGWIPAYALDEVAAEYNQRKYQRVIILRGFYEGGGTYESREWTGKYMVETLIQLGVPKERVDLMLFNAARVDRTYQSAIALREWAEKQGVPLNTLDIATAGPHARRSRILFERALGEHARVGVIALEEQSYDSAHWWRTSSGVRAVPFELFAYLYAKLFFKP